MDLWFLAGLDLATPEDRTRKGTPSLSFNLLDLESMELQVPSQTSFFPHPFHESVERGHEDAKTAACESNVCNPTVTGMYFVRWQTELFNKMQLTWLCVRYANGTELIQRAPPTH